LSDAGGLRGDGKMSTTIKIFIGNLTLQGELTDTACAKQIIDKLPVDTMPNEWGDEFYFSIPVKAPLDETATTKVKVGDIGYWPPGNAMAIFFGKTPMSTGVDPVPASSVNVIGRILDDATALKQVKGASRIRIEKLDL
jgi:hypothetical protein